MQQVKTEVKSNVGVLTFAFGPEYQKQAYAQALTLRKSIGLPMTVVVSKDEVTNIAQIGKLAAIANVLPISGKFNKFEYEQLALELTPYDITFKTDADLLFPAGATLYHADHLPASSGVACDIHGSVSNTETYRRVESEIGVPAIYSACFSFDKRASKTVEFFDTIKDLYRNWYRLNVWSKTEKVLSPTTDSVYSLAWMRVFGTARADGNKFLHAKPIVCPTIKNSLTEDNTFMMDTNCRMYLDGVRICMPFHYYDKSFLNNELIERLENVCADRETKPVAKPGRKRVRTIR